MTYLRLMSGFGLPEEHVITIKSLTRPPIIFEKHQNLAINFSRFTQLCFRMNAQSDCHVIFMLDYVYLFSSRGGDGDKSTVFLTIPSNFEVDTP